MVNLTKSDNPPAAAHRHPLAFRIANFIALWGLPAAMALLVLISFAALSLDVAPVHVSAARAAGHKLAGLEDTFGTIVDMTWIMIAIAAFKVSLKIRRHWKTVTAEVLEEQAAA